MFSKDGKNEGYAYVRRDGRIGPVAVKSSSSLEEVMSTAITLAADQDVKKVTVLYTGSNEQVVSAALKHGLRITNPMLFMSTKPLRHWANYICYSPGLM